VLSTTVLDVGIGLVFVYLLLSLICTAILEVIAALFSLRAKNLEAGIRSIFSDGFGPDSKAFVEQVYDHGLVAGLYRNPAVDLVKAAAGNYQKPSNGGAKKLPSYIPSRIFALALIDILNIKHAEGDALTLSVKDTLTALPDSKAKQALLSLVADANGKAENLRENFENWYNSAMDRTSGWYKKRTQYILLAIGIVVAVIVNADSVNIARTLYIDPGVRSAVVNNAATFLTAESNGATTCATQNGSGDPQDVKDLKIKLCSLENKMDAVTEAESTTLLPVGWKGQFGWRSLIRWPAIGGWVLTAIALSLGAPFWFDLLNKFMVIRSTIKPQEKSPIEKSKA
jgi:hypothetical protein